MREERKIILSAFSIKGDIMSFQDKLKQTNLGPLAAATISNFVWGLSFLLMRVAMQVAGDDQYLTLSCRFFIASVVMVLIGLIRKEKVSLKGKHVFRFAILLIAEVAYFYFETLILKYSNSVFTGVSMSLSPVFSIGFAALFLKEIPPLKKILFAILPIVGVALISIAGRSIGVVQPIAVLFLILTCASAGTIRTLQRSTSREFSTYERTVSVMIACFLAFTMTNLIDKKFDFTCYIIVTNLQFILPVAALGLFASVLANMLSNYAAGKLPVMY